MADWTAITGIVVSGVVGPSVGAYWALRQQKRKAVHEVELADRAAGRALLDKSAETVQDAAELADAVGIKALARQGPLGKRMPNDECAAAAQELRDASRQVALLHARVEIMFGSDSNVARALSLCAEKLRFLGATVGVMPRYSDDDLESMEDDVERFAKELIAAQKLFVNDAHVAVGIRPNGITPEELSPEDRDRLALGGVSSRG